MVGAAGGVPQGPRGGGACSRQSEGEPAAAGERLHAAVRRLPKRPPEVCADATQREGDGGRDSRHRCDATVHHVRERPSQVRAADAQGEGDGGPSVGQQGGTPLFMACQMGHLECARVLLKAKANPTWPGWWGDGTELRRAAGHLECARPLLKAKATVDHRNHRLDAAHHAHCATSPSCGCCSKPAPTPGRCQEAATPPATRCTTADQGRPSSPSPPARATTLRRSPRSSSPRRATARRRHQPARRRREQSAVGRRRRLLGGRPRPRRYARRRRARDAEAFKGGMTVEINAAFEGAPAS